MATERMSDGGVYEVLRKELGNIHLVDAHEHLPGEEQWLAREINFTGRNGIRRYEHR